MLYQTVCSANGDTSRQTKPFCIRVNFYWSEWHWCCAVSRDLCDFNLHLWCKIKRIVNRFHWCSSPFFPPASSLQFRLQYNGLNNPVWSQKKGPPRLKRWHFNSCWADKNNVLPSINGSTHPKIKLCVCRCDSTRQRGEHDSKWWCNVCSVGKRVSKKHKVRELVSWWKKASKELNTS